MAERLHGNLKLCGLNLLDPELKGIIDFSAFVAIYKFSPAENQWNKTDVEGTLFVYARSGVPSHRILVSNRLSPNNFIEPINRELILRRREPFLFYVTANCSLYGIWFYKRADCERVTFAIESVKRQLVTTPVVYENWSDITTFKSVMRMSDSPMNSDRDSSLAKKSDKSDEKMSAQTKKSGGGRKRIAARLSLGGDGNPGTSDRSKKPDGEKELAAAAARAAVEQHTEDDADQTPKSVVDFFARAGCAPINTQVGLMPGMTHMYGDDNEGASMNPIVHQIVTNPCHSLEHVEKQQMMASSQQPKAANTQKQKTMLAQKPKASSTQKPQTANKQKPKEQDTQKTEEGERKSSDSDAPTSLVEFLAKLKTSRSTNPDPEDRNEEFPDLLSLIPEPPLPNLTSMQTAFQSFSDMQMHTRPAEAVYFGHVTHEAYNGIPLNGNPFSPKPATFFANPEMGYLNLLPPQPSALVPEPPAAQPPTPEPPAALSQMPEPHLPSSPPPERPLPLSSILRQARLSLPSHPVLPKPTSLLKKPPELSLSSMPPTMFASETSNVDVDDDYNHQAGTAAAGNNADEDHGGVNFKESGGNGEDAIAAPNPQLPIQDLDFVDVLTKEQLLQAIHYLLRNDPSFIKEIHEAYLKTLMEKYP